MPLIRLPRLPGRVKTALPGAPAPAPPAQLAARPAHSGPAAAMPIHLRSPHAPNSWQSGRILHDSTQGYLGPDSRGPV